MPMRRNPFSCIRFVLFVVAAYYIVTWLFQGQITQENDSGDVEADMNINATLEDMGTNAE